MSAFTIKNPKRVLDVNDARDDNLSYDSAFSGRLPPWIAAFGLDAQGSAPALGFARGAVVAAPTPIIAAPTPDSAAAPVTAGATPSAAAPMSASALPAWISSLADGGIAADMTAAATGGTVSYSGMLNLFNDLDARLASGKTSLSAKQFASLKTIAADLGSGLSVSSYLQDVTDSLVNGCAANATWTGGAASPSVLGNLAAGSSAATLGELVGKWYLGTDLPCATVSMSGESAFTVSYQSLNEPLFAAGGPSMNDVNQGDLGDCYLLASLAEVAKQNPSIISSMIQSNGNDTFGVRFFIGGQADWVTVNNALPNSGSVFNKSPDMWADLVEKAYAQLQASGVVTGNSDVNFGNSWSTIGNGGVVDYALQEISGASAITELYADGSSWASYTWSPEVPSYRASGASGLSTASVLSALSADLKSGYDLVLSSMTNAYDSANYLTLVAGHAMSVIGVDSPNSSLVIRNPWGSPGPYWDTTFEVSLSTLLSAGDAISVDNVSSALTLNAQTPNLIGSAGKSFSYTLATNTFIDPQSLALTETATLSNGQALPSWLIFDAAAGTFSGTPMNAGVTTVTLTANDPIGLSASETFSITVGAPPSITAQTANLSERAGKNFSYALAANTFTDPQGSALTYNATESNGQALPPWLAFNAVTRAFSGTPSVTGSTSVTVTATDVLGLSASETFSLTVTAPPIITAPTANPAGTTADMILRHDADGLYESYNIGNNSLLAGESLGQVETDNRVVGLGHFGSSDTTDMMLRSSSTGAFEAYNIGNNNITSATNLGAVGSDWSFAGFGDFNHDGTTDMMLRNAASGSFEAYSINNNQITSASNIGAVGLDWQVAGFGDFNGDGTSDVMLRNAASGTFEAYDIKNSQLSSASNMGAVGLDWQVAGFGDFNGDGTSDMMLRNAASGTFELYDIINNHIAGASAIGAVGLDWQVAGFGPIGSAGASDMVLRNSSTGTFEVYNIAHDQLTTAASLGTVGLDWQVAGFAAVVPPAHPMSTLISQAGMGSSITQLVQAMAGFSSGGAAINQGAIGQAALDGTSQPSLFAAPSLAHAA